MESRSASMTREPAPIPAHTPLVGAGWNIVNLDGVTDITNFFNGTGATNINNAGIMMIDSGTTNVFGGIDFSEEAVLTANAALINSFVGAGGGLFSQASELDWLSALIPGIAITHGGDGTALVLTAEGHAAFPGLTDADIQTFVDMSDVDDRTDTVRIRVFVPGARGVRLESINPQEATVEILE